MIKLNNITKNYRGKFVLNNISYHFPTKQKIALFGVNGAGKSTLLNIICALDECDFGAVEKPKNLTIGYLPQEPNKTPNESIWLECLAGAKKLWEIKGQKESCLNELEQGNYSEEILNQYNDLEDAFMTGGGYELESLAFKILIGLGFKEENFTKSPTDLSGGWRMRLELARTLINQPDFLVLDEPTNHLDLPALEWLERYLSSFNGTILFVSHDQDFLNKLATIVLHLSGGLIKEYKGNLDYFLEQRELSQLQSEAKAKHIQARAKHIQKFVDKFRASPAKAGMVSSRLKMLDRLRDLEGSIFL
jgi:ATP-binding cassette subfamily F protein 3